MASDAEREDLVQAAKAEQQAKPRVRRAPKPQGEDAAPRAVKVAQAEDADAPQSEGEAAPKKRRRRRRKPGAGGEQGAASAE